VEKLLYVLWKPAAVTAESWRREILGRAAPELAARGAQALSVNLADEFATFAQALRITRMDEPVAGTVSVWMHTALDRTPVEAMLAGVTERLAGYLVVESVPIVNTTHVVPLGERTPGICTVAFLETPGFLTHAEWLERWQGHHTQVAIETQSTFLYVQNVVVRPLTTGAPPWAAIVEEGFPAAAAADPMVFYDARGSKERLRENRRRMLESCQRFIDFARLESHPMSAYVLKAF
jgi:hypothetical protein